MKKYTSQATKRLAVITVIFCTVLLAGIVLTVTEILDVEYSILMIGLGGSLSILFLCVFLAERSRVLVIDTDKIVFPRGAYVNGKMVFERTLVKLSEIRSVESKLHKGDGLISADTTFHTLKLKDGKTVTVPLYAYGKDAETEIVESIRRSIVCITEKPTVEEQYRWLKDTFSHCGSFLLGLDNEELMYHLFEEFDANATSFLHPAALDPLRKSGYIDDGIVLMCQSLREMYFKLRINNKLWSTEEVKTSLDWLALFRLADEIHGRLAK